MATKSRLSNFRNPDINPCMEETDLFYKCLNEKQYDYAECFFYVENYKKCKTFWNIIRRKRLRAGISPNLPVKAERDEILRLQKEGKVVFKAEIPTEEK